VRLKILIIFMMAAVAIVCGISGTIDLYKVLGPTKAYIAYGLFFLYFLFLIRVSNKKNENIN